MDTTKWKSVAIKNEIYEIAKVIGEKTERPTSNVFAYAVLKLMQEINEGSEFDVRYTGEEIKYFLERTKEYAIEPGMKTEPEINPKSPE